MILFRIILVSGIVFLLYKLVMILIREKRNKKRNTRYSPNNSIEEMKKDPICGTYVPESQAIIVRLNDQIYYFCSEKCKKKFKP